MIKIISGGQTGVDRIALEVAKELGIPTGGTAAKGWMTETGPDLSLKEFGLVECEESGYPPRTRKNVIDSDATVLFGDMTSQGCMLTIKLCKQYKKDHLKNPTWDEIEYLIRVRKFSVLNIAGNRSSKLTKEHAEKIRAVIRLALKTLTGNIVAL